MRFRGVAEWMVAVEATVQAVDAAARGALSQAALHEKQTIQANMTGPPRWVGHRHEPRSGGPGELTGKLKRSVHYSKIQRLGYAHYTTTVRAGRIYAARTESRYAYFVPGARAAEPRIARIFEETYAAALSRF